MTIYLQKIYKSLLNVGIQPEGHSFINPSQQKNALIKVILIRWLKSFVWIFILCALSNKPDLNLPK
jgi:hypothetical protein